MLTELRITDLGVIGEVVLEPGPGFTAVTGETGAGKTMVVTGLGLLLGTRAEPRLVRRGAARALIESRWSVADEVAGRIVALGGETEDGEVLISRQVGLSRSRSFVGGAGVPVAVAGELVADWAAILGQAEQVRLGTSERQRDVLDRFAGRDVADLLERYAHRFAERREAAAELDDLTTRTLARARELDLLAFGLGEIAAVGPEPGEDVALAQEAARLQAADDLRRAARAALAALTGDEFDDAASVLSLLGVARKAVANALDADAALVGAHERLNDANAVLVDVTGELAGYLADLDADPGRLEWVAERRSRLQHLTRKYGHDIDEVLAWAAEATERSASLSSSDERISELGERVARLDEQLRAEAAELTRRRRRAADTLVDAVGRELADLALPSARIEFRITPLPDLGPHGGDQVQLLFSSHPGAEPGPLGKVASGGELSRVRLALEVVLAGQSEGQTFVFDEVDAGVGGAVALEIGRRLARLAEHLQVIVVTHLAQVAAFADKHYVVHKAEQGLVTTSGVVEVGGAERQRELARMMAGLESTDTALAHAAELLDEAAKIRER